MRFSSVFQETSPQPQPRQDEGAREKSAPARAAPAPDLPDDLDARVRLVGEWQLGEA